ncbi:MAG TPA: hypothetical protein VNW29_00890 [Candidatus Sulfotelmatobacter sp.]|jgi:hypothetical protein|nr:hypothetical protein [Candidatus Sulfotelmatobacter sp.]
MINNKLHKIIKRKRIIFSLSLILIVSHFSVLSTYIVSSVSANTISNNNYSIDVRKIDTNPQPSLKIRAIRENNIEIKKFTTGPNYTSTASNDTFSINLPQNIIDYGILSSTNPVIRSSQISFLNPQLGAEILTVENHPLFSVTNDVIQNTNCDNGACTSITASLWKNTLTYGFGYRCDSANSMFCDQQFSFSNYYKQYPDNSRNQDYQMLLINKSGSTLSKVNITYKVNISGTQKPGGYYNSITYLAIPNF